MSEGAPVAESLQCGLEFFQVLTEPANFAGGLAMLW